LGLLEQFGEPILSTTLIPAGETEALNDAQEIRERYEHQLAAVIDSGACPKEPTTVIDLSGDEARIIRDGRGDPSLLGIA
jgi:tRNA A37 threonylcarbamoyladenosine synthetase subunit TsaC/SUA5/YrdC